MANNRIQDTIPETDQTGRESLNLLDEQSENCDTAS